MSEDDSYDDSFEDVERHLEMRRINRQSHLVELSGNSLNKIIILLETTKPVNELEKRLCRGLWEAAKALAESNPFIKNPESLNDRFEEFKQKWEKE